MLSEKGMQPSTVQTLEEGFDLMRLLSEESGKRSNEIKRNSRELVELRFCQGVLAERMMDMPRGEHYGEGLMKELANYTVIGVSSLYKWRKVARHPEFKCNLTRFQTWAEGREREKGGRLTASYVLNWTNKHLPSDEKEAQDELEQKKEKLLEKADRRERQNEELENEAEDLRSELQRRKGPANGEAEDTIATARGIAAQGKQVVQDLRRQAERLEVKGAARIESEAYLQHVREYPCAVCGQPNVDPHHIETRGTSQKAHDLWTIPLCRKHHNAWHDSGGETFCREHGLRPWREVTCLLTEFIAGAEPGTLQ